MFWEAASDLASVVVVVYLSWWTSPQQGWGTSPTFNPNMASSEGRVVVLESCVFLKAGVQKKHVKYCVWVGGIYIVLIHHVYHVANYVHAYVPHNIRCDQCSMIANRGRLETPKPPLLLQKGESLGFCRVSLWSFERKTRIAKVGLSPLPRMPATTRIIILFF